MRTAVLSRSKAVPQAARMEVLFRLNRSRQAAESQSGVIEAAVFTTSFAHVRATHLSNNASHMVLVVNVIWCSFFEADGYVLQHPIHGSAHIPPKSTTFLIRLVLRRSICSGPLSTIASGGAAWNASQCLVILSGVSSLIPNLGDSLF